MSRFDPHPTRRPAIVTGASAGIGEATARVLAAAGHPVVLGARRVDRCQAVVDAIVAAGGEAAAAFVDVTDGSSVAEFAAAAEAAVGPIEILVANAGDTALGTGVDTAPEDFAQQVAVNFLGAQALIASVVPGMVTRQRGDVVVISSDIVREPRPGMAPYMSAKWGLEGLARAMQMELEGSGVRASVVRPGPTMTEMGRGWNPDEFASAIDAWVKWGVARHDSFMRPEDVAQAVLAVVSVPRGAHITLLEIEPEGPVA
ncbi:MAG TPA: SDR family oxidoreductase [Acidimicrobiales bacterium]|nr:SDR family oxidoreductase [Acidimicrobiales bacterium]